VQALAVEQVLEVQAVLAGGALRKGVQLEVVHRNPILENGGSKLDIEGEVQKGDASLAIAVAASHLRMLGVSGAADVLDQP
jgi:folylpolyglutamate synthase